MAEPRAGTLINRKYRILSELGRGAMGVVYRAEQLDPNGTPQRQVALKMMRREFSAAPDFARRFLREIQVAMQVHSPYVVTVYDSGRDEEGRLYYVMELVSGPTLKEVLQQQGSLPVARVIKIAGQICEALAEAHRLPVVHRDLKPSNIFLAPYLGQDWVKISDFGIAKVLGELASTLTTTSMSPGTPLYMAPEQWLGQGVDGRTDLYALGLVMYELLAGRPPFAAEQGQEALRYQHLYQVPPPLPVSIPAGIRQQVERLLAKAASERPADALSVRRALEAVVAGEDEQSTVRAESVQGAERREKKEPYEQDKVVTVRSLPSFFVRMPIVIGGIVTGVLIAVFVFFRPDLFPPTKEPPEPLPPIDKSQPQAIGVMSFKALSADPQLEWIREAIRDNLNSKLRDTNSLKVYSKEYIDFLVQKGSSSEIEIANQLGIGKMISGSFLAAANKLRIEAHIVDVRSGLLEASENVEGEQSSFFDLHTQLAVKIMARLNIQPEHGVVTSTLPTPSVDTYKLLLDAVGETGIIRSPKEGVPRSHVPLQQEENKRSTIPLGWWLQTSVAWADEIPQQKLTPEEEILQTLERYRLAYEKKDLALLETVFHPLTETQREASVKYFQNVRNLQVLIRDVDIAVIGDEAAVSYTREDQFLDVQTGRNVKLDARFTSIFVRKDGIWKIHIRRE